MISLLDFWIEQSWFQPWLTFLYCVLGQGTSLSVSLLYLADFSFTEHLANWSQFFMCLSCYWSWILSCHNLSKQPGRSLDHFDNIMRNFIVNNWTDLWKTIMSNIYLHVTIANGQIVCSGWLTQCMNWKFICPSTYWQWKLASDHSRISSVIVKICNVQFHSYKGSLSVNSFKYLFLAEFIPLSISEVHVGLKQLIFLLFRRQGHICRVTNCTWCTYCIQTSWGETGKPW